MVTDFHMLFGGWFPNFSMARSGSSATVLQSNAIERSSEPADAVPRAVESSSAPIIVRMSVTVGLNSLEDASVVAGSVRTIVHSPFLRG